MDDAGMELVMMYLEICFSLQGELAISFFQLILVVNEGRVWCQDDFATVLQ